MLIEYPTYYNDFRCIADKCPDTCCAGWEVNVDDDSFYYYQVVPGKFGDRLRKTMVQEDGETFFPLTSKNRCPFLNDRNLCDIYANLGEESLCQVCTEYPRYYMEIGNYEQIDMSLSCMELSRIFFTGNGPIEYIRSENDAEGDEIDPEDEVRLWSVINARDSLIAALQNNDGMKLADKLSQLGIVSVGRTGSFESDRELLEVLKTFETINPSWTRTLADISELVIKNNLKTGETKENEEGGETEETGDVGKPGNVGDINAALLNEKAEVWFTRLAVYLVFRYSIDSYLEGEDGVGEATRRLIARSLRLVYLMCIIRKNEKGSFDIEDMIDTAHRFSKEVEHSEENVDRIAQK